MTLTEFDTLIAEYTKIRQRYLTFRAQIFSGEITKDTPGFHDLINQATKDAVHSCMLATKINKNVWPDSTEI